jgi:hypothetical protein
MTDPFALLWTVLIFSSIAWYFYLLFHVGWRGGRDIVVMARNLKAQAEQQRSGEN